MGGSKVFRTASNNNQKQVLLITVRVFWKMVSDDVFYRKFRDWVLGNDAETEELKVAAMADRKDDDGNVGGDDGKVEVLAEMKSQKITFLLHQLEIIPVDVREMYRNVMRGYPTSPLFLLLGLGTIGSNVARYSAVRRKSAHEKNVIRTGCFYKLLAPSRYGKGIAMGFMHELGGHVESLRVTEHDK